MESYQLENTHSTHTPAPIESIVAWKGCYQTFRQLRYCPVSTDNISNFSLATRLDAVSLSSVVGTTADLYREGTSLQSHGANDGQYAYARKLVTGVPQDRITMPRTLFLLRQTVLATVACSRNWARPVLKIR